MKNTGDDAAKEKHLQSFLVRMIMCSCSRGARYQIQRTANEHNRSPLISAFSLIYAKKETVPDVSLHITTVLHTWISAILFKGEVHVRLIQAAARTFIDIGTQKTGHRNVTL